MARPTKNNLDYFPQDVDFLQDIKICKLKRSQGGKAIAVWISLLCRIYGSDGYYMKWDEELPFIIAEELPGFDEVYIQEVIKSCLNFGLLDKALFESENILTSAAIQRRYVEAKEKNRRTYTDTINPRYKLFASPDKYQNAVVFSEKTRVSTEKIGVFSEKTPTKESKVKERKGKTPSSVDDVVAACATSSPSQESPKVDFINVIGNDKSWLASVAQNMHIGGGMERITSLFNQFRDEQKMVDKVHTSISDSKQHFISWLRIKLRESAGIGRKAARFTATDPNGYEGKF